MKRSPGGAAAIGLGANTLADALVALGLAMSSVHRQVLESSFWSVLKRSLSVRAHVWAVSDCIIS